MATIWDKVGDVFHGTDTEPTGAVRFHGLIRIDDDGWIWVV
jgi:hypothetical protein